MIKNAFAYITRKSLKSIIIMLVILAMSTLSLISDGAGFAVQKAIIHSRRHGFGVPCSTVIVAEIRGLASSRICR